ncbi:MAG: hypothetical protein ABFD25_20230 [Clostridiaceae bacterium]
MSIQLLYETLTEVRRLYIAGCEMAADDFKLKKLLPQMQKAGESAPVFARVADALNLVLQPGGSNSVKMLELANLINAILYTQGQTSADGELEDIIPAGLNTSTEVSYRRIQPVMEALTGQGSGRLEVIREAYIGGNCHDIRLVYPLIAALNDSYPDIADLASEILEGFGPAVVKVLKKSLLLDDGKGHARRIGLISKINGSKEKEFYLEVIEKGASEAKAAAIRALKDLPECEELLQELSRDRKKDNREASLFALAHLGTDAAVKRLYEVFSGNERNLAVYPIKLCMAKGIALLLVKEGERLLANILKSEKGFSLFAKKVEPPSTEVLEYFAVTLECMEGKQDPEVFQFLEKCLIHAKHLQQFKIASSLQGVRDNLTMIVAENIMVIGSVQAMELLESVRGKYDDILAAYSFEAAVRSRSADYVFDHYSRYLKEGRKSEEGQRILEVMDQYIDFEEQYQLTDIFSYERKNQRIASIDKSAIKWDPRWLKMLADMDETSLACRLITKNDSRVADSLARKLAGIGEQDTKSMKDIIRGLLQAGYPDMIGIIGKAIDKYFKNARYYSGYLFNDFAQVLRFLPKECAKGVEELALKQDNASAAKLYEIAQYLKLKE